MGRYKEVNCGRDKEIEACSSCGGDGCNRCNNYGYFEVTYQLISNHYYDDYGNRSPSSDYDTEREISRRPVRKGGSSGGCYITTATLEYLQTDNDSCQQLETFRRFRDEYIISKNNENDLVDRYYEVAPRIVQFIEADINRDEIYKYIYEGYLQQCYLLIHSNCFEEAKRKYISMVNMLENKYL